MASLYFGTTNEKISGLFVMTLGAAPGATYLSQANTAGLNGTAQALINATGASTTSALADIILSKLGVPSSDTAAKAEVLAFLGGANASVANAGAGLVSLFNAVAAIANPSNSLYATYGSYASTFVSNLETAAAYSSVSTNTSTDLSTLQGIVSNASAPVGTSFTLTSDIQGLSGTAYADTFTAVSNSTYQDGDSINGGAGTDTLVITGNSSAALVSLDSVENVDVRLLSATTLNAISWSGVSQVEITNNSIDDKALTISNAAFSTTYKVSDNDDLNVTWLDTSGSSDTALLSFNNAGISGNVSQIDVGSAGGLEAVSVTLAGTNYLDIEVGASATSLTVAGTGSIELSLDDPLTTLSLASFSGTASVSAAAAVTNLTVTGGTGNDTLNLGATFNSNDSFDGGAGADTLKAVVNNTSVQVNHITNVETGNFSFSGTTATLGFSGSNFTTVNLTNASGTAVTLNDLAANTVVNLKTLDSAVGLEDVTVDYVAGATASVVLAATSTADFGALTISDAVTVNLLNTGASGTQEVSGITLDAADTKNLNITLSGSSTVLISAGAAVTGALLDNVTISVSDAAKFNDAGDFLLAASSLNTLTLNAAGSSANYIHLGSGIMGSSVALAQSASFTLAVSATDGADVYAQGAQFYSANVTVDVNLGAGSNFGNWSAGTGVGSGFAITQNGTTNIAAFNVTVAASGNAAFDAINLGAGSSTISDLNLTVAQSASFALTSAVAAHTLGNINVNGAGSASFDTLTVSAIGAIAVSGVDGFTITDLYSADTVGNITLTALKSGATISNIDAKTVGDITLAGSGTVNIAAVSANTIGAVSAAGLADTATLTLNLSSVVTGVQINLGKGTNTVTSSLGDDSITLAAASGIDTIRYTATAQAADQIYNFQAGTDTLSFGSGFAQIGGIYSAALNYGSTTTLLMVSASTYTLASANTYALDIRSGTFGTITDVLNSLKSGGSMVISSNETVSAGSDILVIWTDGTDTHVTDVTLSAHASGDAIFTASDTNFEVATLYGVGYSGLADLTAGTIQLNKA